MKFKIVFLIFFISITVNCQLDSVSKTFSAKLTNKNKKKYKVYLLRGNKYETDEETFFSSEKGKIFEKNTDDAIEFRTYKKRYLFIGYYKKTIPSDTLPSAIPKSLKRLEVIDLENSSNKWSYNTLLKGLIMINIHSFDPENGVITYNYYLRPTRKD